jgi:hypothetical protein
MHGRARSTAILRPLQGFSSRRYSSKFTNAATVCLACAILGTLSPKEAWPRSIYVPGGHFAPSGVQALPDRVRTPTTFAASSVSGSWIGTLGHPGDVIFEDYRYQLDIRQSANGTISGSRTATSM